MKAFQFKLQPVLDLRSQAVERIQQRLAAEELKLQEIQNAVAQIHSESADIRRSQEEALGHQIDLAYIHQLALYLKRLEESRSRLQKFEAYQQKVIHVIRQELQQALIQQKALEKLKENRQKIYQQKLDYLEAQQLEELVQSRYSSSHRFKS